MTQENVHIPNIIIIHGTKANGGSGLADAFVRSSAWQLYELSEDPTEKAVQSILRTVIENSSATSKPHAIILADQKLSFARELEQSYIEEASVISVCMDRFRAYIGNDTVFYDALPSRQSAETRYDALAEQLLNWMQSTFAGFLAPRTVYQRYDIIPDMGLGSSLSNEKFSALEPFLLSPTTQNMNGKRALDVGCNEGYLSLGMVMAGADVTGIDIHRPNLTTASRYINAVFHAPSATFFHSDFFEFESGPFNTILCASTFHYFRNRQEDFLQKARALLIDAGELILEVGVSQEGGDQPFVEKYARHVDSDDCHFPNDAEYLRMARQNSFELVDKGRSIDQAGDPIPRFIYKFRACA